MIIYRLYNTINGKSYVGQTLRTLHERVKGHVNESKSLCRTLVAKAIRKYEWTNFKVTILAECSSQEELDAMEIKSISRLNTQVPNGYNIANGGCGVGQHSEQTKLKMSKQRKGKPLHENCKLAVSNANKVRVLSDTTRLKLVEAQKGNTKSLGRIRPAEERLSIGLPQRGEGNHRAKLTWELVATIRNAYDTGTSVGILAKKHKVEHSTVSNIVRNKTWVL